MADKRPKKSYEKLSQKEKFIAAGVDETGETFLRSVKTIAKAKPHPMGSPATKAEHAAAKRIDKTVIKRMRKKH